jgi:hypothetical protein
MRRIAAVLVAGALVATIVVASATSAVRARPRVSVIGDSIITAVDSTPPAKAFLGRSVDLRFLAITCRRLVQPSCWYNGARPPTAMDVIRAGGASLGGTVVVESGYNEYVQVYSSDIDTVMQALVDAGAQTVLWLTLREQRPDYATMNSQIREAATRWPQLVVVDWNAASRNRAWFNSDGLHLNEQGAFGMARLLRTFVVEYACAGSCAHVPRPEG